jgi:hypothetical protein
MKMSRMNDPLDSWRGIAAWTSIISFFYFKPMTFWGFALVLLPCLAAAAADIIRDWLESSPLPTRDGE